jgi:hypothetical protein
MNMELDVNIQITKVVIEIPTLFANKGNIRGTVHWTFITNQGDIKVKWGTIRQKDFGQRPILTYEPPAVQTKANHYLKSFFIDNKDLFRKLSDASVAAYCKESGEPLPSIVIEEEINLDEIPI